MIEISNIGFPKSWIVAKLSDMVIDPKSDFVDGPFGSNLKASEYKDEGIPVFKIQNIKAGYFLDKNIQFVTLKKAEQLKRHSFQLGDIIITKLGEPLGLCCKVPTKYPYGIIVADLMRVRPSDLIVDTGYLVYAINSQIIQNQFKRITKGTTRARVNLTIVRDIEIPIAPMDEQKRIVSKLDEILSELENGKGQLQTSLEQLKVYRQSILKHAFEGRLTEGQRKNKKYPKTDLLLDELSVKRKQNNAKLKYHKINQSDLKQLIPNQWKWVRNEEILKYVTSGSRDWKKYYSEGGSHFIRTQDIKTNVLDINSTAFVKLPSKVEGKRSLVEKHDLLMTITGANVGKVAIIENDIPEAYVSQSVALMKFLEPKIAKYLWYYFQSKDFGQGLINSLVYGVGRPVLSLENMKEVPVALCSLEEQEEIIEEIDSRFSICDKLEELISRSIKEIEPLKQSLLQKAFEGKLVEQDPNHEPASVLLERLRKTRAEFLKKEKEKRNSQIKTMKKKTPLKEEALPLSEFIKNTFSKKEFTFEELRQKIDTHYDDLKEEVFKLLDDGDGLKMSYNKRIMKMKFKFIGK